MSVKENSNGNNCKREVNFGRRFEGILGIKIFKLMEFDVVYRRFDYKEITG